MIELTPFDFDVYEYYIEHCEQFTSDQKKISELRNKYERARKAYEKQTRVAS